MGISQGVRLHAIVLDIFRPLCKICTAHFLRCLIHVHDIIVYYRLTIAVYYCLYRQLYKTIYSLLDFAHYKTDISYTSSHYVNFAVRQQL